MEIVRGQGIFVEAVRVIDHDIARGLAGHD
jgi:hypothetical protein